MGEAGMAARKNLHAKPLKGCIQATQVRGNSANTRISTNTTVKLSIIREQRARVNYQYVIIDIDIDRKGKKCKEKKIRFLTGPYKSNSDF